MKYDQRRNWFSNLSLIEVTEEQISKTREPTTFFDERTIYKLPDCVKLIASYVRLIAERYLIPGLSNDC